jgi:hypothetical protein
VTPSLPESAWVATAEQAGGSAAGGAAFFGQLGGGAKDTATISLVFTGAEWTQLEQGDQKPPSHGDGGTYTLDGNALRLNSDPPCWIDLNVELAGQTMHLTVKGVGPSDQPTCGNLLLPVTVLYNTAPFTRTNP